MGPELSAEFRMTGDRYAAANLRSAAIPERLGFRKEGVLHQSEFRDGQLHVFITYELFAERWPKRT
jgi:ribosomal-protein-serine acetyltransferase